MNPESTGQATVARMLLASDKKLQRQLSDFVREMFDTRGLSLSTDTLTSLTVALKEEFSVGKAHVIIAPDENESNKS